jgi:hypothetical protein
MPLSRIQTDVLQNAITSANILDGTIATVDVANGAITQPKLAAGALEGYMATNGSNFTLRNKLVNGAMTIDQRNAGSSINVSTNTPIFVADRFLLEQGAISSSSDVIQRVTDAPAGFANSLKYTASSSVTSYSSNAGWKAFSQRIEGQNLQDLKYGTASAEQTTLSFWVKTSVTGPFGILLSHYDGSNERFIVQNYTVNAVNTWEYKTITFAGDTAFGITNDNGATGWIRVYWVIGGDPAKGWATADTSNAWFTAAGTKRALATATNATIANATFQITGAQFERGSTASAFEYRPIGTELALCQRYCIVYGNPSSSYERFGVGNATSSTVADISVFLPVQMRTTPTAVTSTVGNFAIYNNSALRAASAISVDFSSSKMVTLTVTTSSLTAASGLSLVANGNSTSFIQFLAEL